MSRFSLTSLADGYRALVFGASGGIGAAMVKMLAADPRCDAAFAAARQPPVAAAKVHPLSFSLEDEASIARCVAMASEGGPLDLVIVATGLLHDESMKPEKAWRAIDAANMQRAFLVNATGPAVIAKHALGHLARGRKAVFATLSARVGSIEDNRLGGWHAYRASKAALNMLVKSFAIELARRNPQGICASLHPGTVDTALSKPFQSGVAAEKLFSAETSTARLLAVIDSLRPEDSGQLIAWDGARLPY